MGIPPVPAQPRFKRITRSETYLIIYLRLRYEATVIYYPDPSILSPFDFFNPSPWFSPIYYVFWTRCILYARFIQLVHFRSRSIGLVSSRHDTSWSRVTGNSYVRAETREWRVLPWNNAYEISFVAWHPVQWCTLADPTVASTFLFRLLRSTLLPSFSCVRSSILSSLRFSSSLLLPFSLCPLLLLILRG